MGESIANALHEGTAMTLADVKIAAAILVAVGIVLSFLSLRREPHTLLLESSPAPSPILKWGGWAVTSISSVAYIALDLLGGHL